MAKIRGLWEGVGMRVSELDAARHDEILAWVSHLPHALAFSAVTALLDVDGAAAEFAGPSWGDLTRVAASSVELWRDIFVANAEQLDAALSRFVGVLEELRVAIGRRDEALLRTLLERAYTARRQWTAAQK